MVSDRSLAELHAFAARLGMPKKAFQDNPRRNHPHYDLPDELRARALMLGAVEVVGTELARRMYRYPHRDSPVPRRVQVEPDQACRSTPSNDTANRRRAMATQVKQIILVGHCGFDSGSLHHAVQRIAPDATVQAINSQSQVDQALKNEPATLLLINRVLDGSFSTGSGIELISEYAQQADSPRLMLVSNYSDAQEEAEQAGALPGFGKGELHSDRFVQCMANALGNAEAESAQP